MKKLTIAFEAGNPLDASDLNGLLQDFNTLKSVSLTKDQLNNSLSDNNATQAQLMVMGALAIEKQDLTYGKSTDVDITYRTALASDPSFAIVTLQASSAYPDVILTLVSITKSGAKIRLTKATNSGGATKTYGGLKVHYFSM